MTDPVAVAAVDLGAGSGRVILGVLQSTGAAPRLTVREVHRFVNRPLGAGGQLQWDVDTLFAETLEGLRRAVASARELGTRLAGIGIDTWGVDYARVDAEVRRLGPARHHRAFPSPEPLIARRRITATRAYELSGILDQSINTAFQLAVDPDAGRGTPLLMPDLWICLLGGEAGAEESIASTTQLLDHGRRAWSPELLDALELQEQLPPVVRAGEAAGRTSDVITRALGADTSVPLWRVGEHDTASALALASPAAPGDATTGLVSSGTWSLVGLCLAAPLPAPVAMTAGITQELGVGGVTLALRNLSGMWLLRACADDWAAEDGEEPDAVALVAAAAEVAGSTHVFDPGDERLLPPGPMVDRVRRLAVEAGRPLPGSRAEIVRAILDSLAEAYAGALRTAAAGAGVELHGVRIVGGGSRIPLLCQATADALGLPVTAGPVEASGIGNIAAQLVACGAIASIPEAFAAVEGSEGTPTTYRPDKEAR